MQKKRRKGSGDLRWQGNGRRHAGLSVVHRRGDNLWDLQIEGRPCNHWLKRHVPHAREWQIRGHLYFSLVRFSLEGGRC